MDIDLGFGRVLRIRMLKAGKQRKHIFPRRDNSPLALKARHDIAYGLLQSRRDLRLQGADTADIERRIRELGYTWQDEDAPDGRYSYWRRLA